MSVPKIIILLLAFLATVGWTVDTAHSNNMCPFCSAVGQTITEKINAADVVVLATLTSQPSSKPVLDSDELPKGEFKVSKIIRGDKWVSADDKFSTILVGQYEVGTTFMVIGVDAPTVAWSTPMKVSKRAEKYVDDLIKLPKSGPARLVFFQNYLQDDESMLAYDAYDEFARAPYADLIGMKDKMKHDKLMAWIQDDEIPVNRKRLYYTMLGVCGTKDDVKVFEKILRSGDRKKQRGLDALVACYLNLTKAEGLKLINEEFLSNPEADYVDLFSVVSALRFHGSEVEFIKKKDLIESMRLVLKRPKEADMVIPDLIRWKDWEMVGEMKKLFEQPTEKTSNFIRVPIAKYLLICPNANAKKAVEELRKVDAMSIERAEKMLQWEMGLEDDDDEDSDFELSDDFKKEEKKSDSKSGDGNKSKKSDKTENPFKKQDSPQQNQSGGKSSSSINKLTTSQSKMNGGGFDSAGALSFQLDHQIPADPHIQTSEPVDSTKVHTSRKIPVKDTPEEIQTGDEPSSEPISITVPVGNDEKFVTTPIQPDLVPVQPNTDSQSGVEKTGTDPPIASQPTWQGTFAIVMIPMTICIFLFLLSWSVINGWFERLIY